jgi:Protein of unknown function (DUF1553)/Protein of unknown function (DUF1549)/Planctomycete cytochrome C/Concanavalin A-like lectin/glucanases superfamily
MQPATLTRFFVLASATILLGAAVWLSACNRSADLPADVVAATKTLPDKVDYNLHVKPILSDRCFACHGPDANKQQAGLRLDIAENAYAALKESGHTAIKPGDTGGSELVHRITSTDPDEVMPTPKSNLSLTADEKAMLIKWIAQGAEYKPHWSLVAPTMPAVPQTNDSGWARNDIDRFVWAKHVETKHIASLPMTPKAEKTTLLRRVSLDLTGLPPTSAEVDAFLADKSPNAYEKVVNRLLSSPHYGERMAVDWLDAARYADTHGYQDDGMRTMWPYRDWVIRAFNKNLSFKTFITWQLAGDLLPASKNKTIHRAMLVATAFNRNHQQSQEGGIVPAEYEAAYVGDRTDTFGKAMLGLTVECARCHDHKYDPISQKDYYALGAFFAQNNEFGQIPYNGEPSPHVTLPTPEADAQLKFIREKLASAEQKQTVDLQIEAKKRFGNWLKTNQQISTIALIGTDRDLVMNVPFDQFADKKEGDKGKEKNRRIFANLANDTLPMLTNGDLDHPIPFVRSPRGQGVRLVGESFLELKGLDGWGKLGSKNAPAWFERNQPFTVSVWVNITDPKLSGPLFNRNLGPFNGFRGYECDRLANGRLAFRLSYVWPDDAIDIETVQKLPLNKWMLLTVTYDGTSRADGVKIYANGQPTPTRIITDNLTQSALWGKKRSAWGAGTPNFAIGQRHDYNYRGYSVDDLRVYGRKLTALETQSLFTQTDNLTAALHNPKRTSAQEAALFDYFLTNVDKPTQENQLTRQALLGQETDILNEQIDVMTMRERNNPRPTFILKRGAYDAPGDRVQPGVLHALNQLPNNANGQPKNRLDLANWLLAPNNPLFARVMVNRFWQQYFGQGLAKNSDDFGNQGALPSHPELLDYLAVRFLESGWNVKALQKMIVMSATYRQSSSVSAAAREADFDNTYLTRGPSYRMGAEQIRDNVLAASGLLNQGIGGPSVYPYQPGGIWEALATRNAVTYTQSHGDTLYRRSIYTIWKRSSPPPMMLNFDAAERHTCIVKRQKTSTPLQALVTLNDPQFVEAARVLAQKEGAKGGRKKEEGEIQNNQIINQFFKALISRPARPDEIKILSALYAEELADFQRNPKRAQTLLAVGEYPVNKQLPPAELAAWTVVASTVMNFDEAIIKR